MINDDNVYSVVKATQTIIDMYFLEHGYGTPAESNALAHRITNELLNEGLVR